MTNHGTFNINSNPKYVFLGVQMKILMTPAQTRGQFGLIEGTMPPGGDGGLHVHRREDECMLILEGTLEVTIGHDTRTLTCLPFKRQSTDCRSLCWPIAGPERAAPHFGR